MDTYTMVKEALLEAGLEEHSSTALWGEATPSGSEVEYYFDPGPYSWYVEYAAREGGKILLRDDAPNNLVFNLAHEKKRRNNPASDLCVKLKARAGSLYVDLDFLFISGLRLSRMHRRPSLRLVTTPVFNIHIRGRDGSRQAELYWDGRFGRGYSFLRLDFGWTNRLLAENQVFREVVAGILRAVGEGDGQHILLDIARAVELDHCFLLPVSMHDAAALAHTPDQLIRSIGNDTRLNVNFNRRLLNAGYLLTKIEPYIEPGDLGLLEAVPDELLPTWAMLQRRRAGRQEDTPDADVVGCVAGYYALRLGGEFAREAVVSCAADYAQMAIQNGERISLRKTTLPGLEQAHDEQAGIMREKHYNPQILARPLVPESSKFERLRTLVPKDFKRMETLGDLVSEAKAQSNCVVSYADEIADDHSAIYHADICGRSYTVEFGMRGNRYFVKQMRQRFNEPAVDADIRLVNEYLQAGEPASRNG